MKKIIEKLYNFCTKLWSEGRKFIDAHIVETVSFVNKLKELVNSPEADAAVKIIPGTWDDIALAAFRNLLPRVTEYLGIYVTCSVEDDPRAFIQCVADEIKKRPEGARAGLYRDLAAQIALAKAEAEKYEHGLSLRAVNLAIEMYFNKKYPQ